MGILLEAILESTRNISILLEPYWILLEFSWGFYLELYWDHAAIYSNPIGFRLESFWNLLESDGSLLGVYWSSIGILMEFYRKSVGSQLGIYSKHIGTELGLLDSIGTLSGSYLEFHWDPIAIY